MGETRCASMPQPPENANAATILARLIDSIGFRLHWATEGLRAEDQDFCPGEGCMSTRELLKHIHGLVMRVDAAFGSDATVVEHKSFETLCAATLQTTNALARRVAANSDEEIAAAQLVRDDGKVISVWHLINGPLADALTHIGQINSWRRLAGNPTRKVNLLFGIPPET
jgi:hypothetical protein